MTEPRIQSYRDLRVWQLGLEQAAHAYSMTREWPREEMFGLTSQIRRSAASVPANIAEGFGRQSNGSFVQFLRNAQGSLKEYETHILLAGKVGLLAETSVAEALSISDNIGRMLGSLIRSAAAGGRVSTPTFSARRPTTDDRRPTEDEAPRR